jgi:glycolate oxidase FAD binding subunit
VASALSGPRRPYAGAVRDFVLGVTMINGRGERVAFGGQVMKNVAGYDVARLMAGSLGILGILLDVSLKVLPAAPARLTLAFEQDAGRAVPLMNRWAGRPLPLTAACWHDGVLRVRLEGTEQGVAAARCAMGGEEDGDGTQFWRRLRDQELPFFAGATRLFRLSLPPAAAVRDYGGPMLIDWGGAQRWVADSHRGGDGLAAEAARAGGHLSLFRDRTADAGGARFAPLSEVAMMLHRDLKKAFDPYGLFNPGRMYPTL